MLLILESGPVAAQKNGRFFKSIAYCIQASERGAPERAREHHIFWLDHPVRHFYAKHPMRSTGDWAGPTLEISRQSPGVTQWQEGGSKLILALSWLHFDPFV